MSDLDSFFKSKNKKKAKNVINTGDFYQRAIEAESRRVKKEQEKIELTQEQTSTLLTAKDDEDWEEDLPTEVEYQTNQENTSFNPVSDSAVLSGVDGKTASSVAEEKVSDTTSECDDDSTKDKSEGVWVGLSIVTPDESNAKIEVKAEPSRTSVYKVGVTSLSARHGKAVDFKNEIEFPSLGNAVASGMSGEEMGSTWSKVESKARKHDDAPKNVAEPSPLLKTSKTAYVPPRRRNAEMKAGSLANAVVKPADNAFSNPPFRTPESKPNVYKAPGRRRLEEGKNIDPNLHLSNHFAGLSTN